VRSIGILIALIAPLAARDVASAQGVPLPRARPFSAVGMPSPPAKPEATIVAKPAPAPAPAPVPAPSACRLRLTSELAIAPSLPPIEGPGECGASDLVLLEAIVLADASRIAMNPPATMRCTMAEAVVSLVRAEAATLAREFGWYGLIAAFGVAFRRDPFDLSRGPICRLAS
jgi:hypothetical protein